jgi:dipeptidyl aminopeptidase/acylaminoacyl peptidase
MTTWWTDIKMRNLWFGLFLLGCAVTAHAAATPSLDALLADPTYASVTLSPDGKQLAAIVQVEGRRQLVVLDRASGKAVASFNFGRSVTGYGQEEVGWFKWIRPGKLIFNNINRNSYDDTGRSFGELYVGDVEKRKMLTLYSARRHEDAVYVNTERLGTGWATLLRLLPSDDKHVLITVYSWENAKSLAQAKAAVYRANVDTGKLVHVVDGPMRGANFLADPRGEVRYAIAEDDLAREHIFVRQSGADNSETWQEIAINELGSESMEPLSISADGNTLYYLARAGAQSTLFARDLNTQQDKLLMQGTGNDIDNIEFDEETGAPLWASSGSQLASTQYLDSSHALTKGHRALLKTFAPAFVALTSVTRDRSEALFKLSYDREPGSYYLFDAKAKTVDLLLVEHPELAPDALLPVSPISVKARDGVSLHGYFTAKSGLKPTQQPMVVLVHGGPYGISDHWSYDAEVQLLASRGYAVLQINFRGSGGYGKQFEESGYREWGGKMQNDVTDATQWALAQGLADPARVCIMGGSYGGYSALMGLVREPNLYRCGISIVGVTDLELMYTEGDIKERKAGVSYLRNALGDEPKELAKRSPAKLADQIKAPVLLLHGGNDRRVPIEHAYRMEKAMKAAGKPVQTFYFDTEGHGFFLLKHRVAAYQKVLEFLSVQLGNEQAPTPVAATQ